MSELSLYKQLKNEHGWIDIYSDPFNKRVRLDDYGGNIQAVVHLLQESYEPWIEKWIVKTRETHFHYFLQQGWTLEAFIPGYFQGNTMYFMTKYTNEKRQLCTHWKEEQHIVEEILRLRREKHAPSLNHVTFATHRDAKELAHLYETVFSVYPTPLSNAEYIEKTMMDGTVYAYIRGEDGTIQSAASGEVNKEQRNAEITDCATLKSARGKGHMKALIHGLERMLAAQNIHCLYTIARARSYGMNKVFHQLGYEYGGRLVHNCYISSGLEDMNVWFKN